MKSRKELKQIISLSQELSICKHELHDELESGSNDFEVDNYIFMKENDALDIAIEQYKCDPYILGCFNDWFISNNCNIPINVVECLQKAEAYEGLGELMLHNGIDDLMEEYISDDGYGHCFGSYDHKWYEIELLGTNYIYFRTN
jgi:hypothetical protein